MQYQNNSNNSIKINRGIATTLLLSQLLVSCGGSVRSIIAIAPDSPYLPSAAAPEAIVPLNEPQETTTAASLVDQTAVTIPEEVYVSYITMAGDQKVQQVDLKTLSISAFLEKVKTAEDLTNGVCRLVYKDHTYKEDDTSSLVSILDLATISEALPTIIKMPNLEVAKELLLPSNYVGLAAYEQLGLSSEEMEAIILPTLSDTMLAEIRRLHALGQRPLLVLDLGISIADLERRCKDININRVLPKLKIIPL